MRNPYKHIGSEPIIATNRGTPEYFVGSLTNQANFNNTINSVLSAGVSLGYTAPADTIDKIQDAIASLNNEKDHNHK
jgi:hypothetical protein